MAPRGDTPRPPPIPGRLSRAILGPGGCCRNAEVGVLLRLSRGRAARARQAGSSRRSVAQQGTDKTASVRNLLLSHEPVLLTAPTTATRSETRGETVRECFSSRVG